MCVGQKWIHVHFVSWSEEGPWVLLEVAWSDRLHTAPGGGVHHELYSFAYDVPGDGGGRGEQCVGRGVVGSEVRRQVVGRGDWVARVGAVKPHQGVHRAHYGPVSEEEQVTYQEYDTNTNQCTNLFFLFFF